MKIMADLDAVHLGLDENEADIAEELQDFDDSFDTRSEASDSGSDSSDSQPTISSVSTTPSSVGGDKHKSNKKAKKKNPKDSEKKATSKRSASPGAAALNGSKNAAKKKRFSETLQKNAQSAVTNTESKSEEKPVKPQSSDSESEDSDSAANIKRNGRKAPSKSASPEKKIGSSSNKSYDYMTKLNYLFRGTHFFLIKSNNADNIALAKSKNVWATLPQNDANLNQAFKESRNVLLIFSVNESGKFAGFARMAAQSSRDIPHPAWILPPSISPKALGGIIELDWICRKELSFNCSSHLYNSWNEGKPVKIGRDGQEIEPKVGAELCRLFPEDDKVELTPILRKSKETAKNMREKGIRVTYRPPPRHSVIRGGRGAGSINSYRYNNDRRNGSSGPMRHKRSYSGGPHRPFKMPPMGMTSGNFKRSSSPYRGGPGGPLERYMTSAAAAEAYVADYMRTMHGQLPPLPFVPPFAQLPLPANAPGLPPSSGPPSMYDQLPPPVRYYDGPPLPDYPPPQPIRPPPPGFDKTPSYEDFAAWKNAGLPTASDSMPPGFTNFNNPSNNGGGPLGIAGSATGSFVSGASGVGSSGVGPNMYRSRNNNGGNSLANRSRERSGGVREYRVPGGNGAGSSRSGGGGHDRHFRMGASERGAHRTNYRDSRR